MTTTSRFEYEFLVCGTTQWRRTRFIYRRAVLGIDEDPVDEDFARETLIVVSLRHRPGTKFRLVRITEELFDAAEQEVTSPNSTPADGRK